jgi:hypothetical protein
MNRLDHIFQYAKIDAPNSHRFLKAILDKCRMQRLPLNVQAIRVRADGHELSLNSISTFQLMNRYNRAKLEYKNSTIIENCKNPFNK